jgi:hypothetical protein
MSTSYRPDPIWALVLAMVVVVPSSCGSAWSGPTTLPGHDAACRATPDWFRLFCAPIEWRLL